MITPLLEKLILKGQASLNVVSHAYGMVGRIPAQSGKLQIITKIIWYPFIDFPVSSMLDNDWLYYFSSNEYSLRIDSGLTSNTYNFRNSMRVTLGNTFDLAKAVAAADASTILIQPGPPIIIDTYLACTDFIKLVIARNSLNYDFINTVGKLSPSATEKPTPNGVGDMDVLLKTVMRPPDPAAGSEVYQPPGIQWSGVAPTPPRNFETYRQDYLNPATIYMHSKLHSPGELSWTAGKVAPTSTLPLVVFHVVSVNQAAADQLISNA